MKKLLLACTLLLAVVGFAAPDAEAQVCLKFIGRCDGICIHDISNQQITSDWYHFDCANNTPMTGGRKGERPVSNACPGGDPSPGALITCENCGGFGDWHFVIDAPLDGTLDMVSGLYPGGTCWIDELAYELTLGAPTSVRRRGAGPAQIQDRSSIE